MTDQDMQNLSAYWHSLRPLSEEALTFLLYAEPSPVFRLAIEAEIDRRNPSPYAVIPAFRRMLDDLEA